MVNCHKKIHSIEAQHTQDVHEGVKTHFVTFNQNSSVGILQKTDHHHRYSHHAKVN